MPSIRSIINLAFSEGWDKGCYGFRVENVWELIEASTCKFILNAFRSTAL
jgi:hypothetical protein